MSGPGRGAIAGELGRYRDGLGSAIERLPMGDVAEVVEAMLDCYDRNGTIFVIGNGGSAATASHIACDLGKGTRTEGMAPIRCVALTDNVPLMTAWANDATYAHVFAEQLACLMREDDLLVAVSVSGNSPNIVAAMEAAGRTGAKTVGLTGLSGGRLGRMADVVVKVPSQSVEQVEDAHLAIGHMAAVAVRACLRARATSDMGERLAATVVLGARVATGG